MKAKRFTNHAAWLRHERGESRVWDISAVIFLVGVSLLLMAI